MAHLEAAADCSGAALRRKQILDAARDAFRTHGFHAASMAVVATGAKMSVGQIYRYFDNKEAIVAAIVGEHIEEFVRDLTMLASEEGPLSERLLNNFCQSIRRHIDSGFLSLAHEVRAEAARHPVLREMLVSKDLQIQNRIVELMRSTDLARLTNEEMFVRAEQVCLLFEGVVARIGRFTSYDPIMINTLVRPLLTAVLTVDDAEPRSKTSGDAIRRTI
jgi:AcrR family transcriptional regulator